ncbi:MAG: type II toxin-antitoxin system VapC family toxin [Desulfobacterales bacterium]
MRLLLDTHVFIWLMFSPEKVSAETKKRYKSYENAIFISLVSLWEIQIKSQLGKLHLDIDLETIIDDNIHSGFVNLLPIGVTHILTLKKLPFYHKDPFDRLLIAQAIEENMTIVTCDSYFSDYPVPVLW